MSQVPPFPTFVAIQTIDVDEEVEFAEMVMKAVES
jgi:hypothetical protein